MLVRPFQGADETAVVELWERCGLTRPWNDPHQDIAQALASPLSAVLVGESDGRIVASVLVGFDGHRAWVYYVSVDPECQQGGLGRILMAAAEDWAREQGARKLELMVRRSNAAAGAFYQALGYVDQDTIAYGKWLDRD